MIYLQLLIVVMTLQGDAAETGGQLLSNDPAVARQALARLKIIAAGDGSADAAVAKSILRKHDEELAGFLKKIGNTAAVDSISSIQLKSLDGIEPGSLSLLYFLPNLGHVAVTAKEFNDANLEIVMRIPELRILSMKGTSVTGRELQPLVLPHLDTIELEDVPFSEEFLSKSEFAALTVLRLSGSLITNKVLGSIKAPRVQSIQLLSTSVDRTGLKEVSRFSQLRVLRVDFASYSDQLLQLIENGKIPITKLVLYCEDDLQLGAAKKVEDSAPRGVVVRVYRVAR